MKKPLCSTGLRWLWLAVLVLVLDAISKQLILSNYGLYESTSVIPYFNLTYVRNYGAAFSFLASQGGWQRWFFTAVAVGISVTLLVMMYRTSARNKLSNIAYALIIGGAIGNLLDRLMHGFVVDYIDFYVGDWHWPTFNLADSWIIIGAGLIIIESVIPDGKKSDKPKNETSSD